MLLSLSYRVVLMPFLPGTQGGNSTALSVQAGSFSSFTSVAFT